MASISTFANGAQINTLGEVELASDLSFLAYTSPYNATADLNIYPINVSTGMFSGTAAHLDITSGTTGMFVGLECSSDNNFVYTNNAGGSIYKINVSNPSSPYVLTSFLPTGSYVDYTNSQIERGHDGKFYMVKSDGELGYFTTYFNGITDYTNIGSSAVINNSILANDPDYPLDMYLIPDQIDGCDYEYTNGDEVNCCYVYNESAVKTPNMTGVTHNSTTGDITINPVTTYPYYVSWTQTSNPFTSGGIAITDVYLKGDITIEQGARLNITGLTLHFKEGESLEMPYSTGSVVGPKLYLYSGSKLTVFDDCDEDALWAGVNCTGYWGTGYAQNATPLLQPYIYMSSATIEYAEIGIDVVCGGIVYGINSFYKDNICDVKFSSWNLDNVSYFRNCDFYTTAALYNKGYNPTYHAHLWTAPSVDFYGCDFFNNNYASVSYSQWGSGILSSLSSLNVNLNSSVPSTFSNLNYGIKASDGDFLTLHNANFTNCVRGAWLISNDAITTTGNNFDVSTVNPSSSLQYDSFGLYIESCTGYQIEGNQFHDGLLGMVIYNSGDEENLVYNNTFENLSGNSVATAFVGIGDNTHYPSDKPGLQLRCNIFNNVSYSIAVLGGQITLVDGSQPNISSSDIRRIQGLKDVNGLWSDVDAHNQFTNIPVVPFAYRYFYINGNVSQIVSNNDKYTYNQINTLGYRLEYYNSNQIYVDYYAVETCPSNISMSMSSNISNLITQTQDYSNTESDMNDELITLTSYNDLSLSISAQSANENNATEVYNSLYAASPNLTSEILLAYLNNSNVPELSRASLMLANSPLPTVVAEAVVKSDLSPEIIAYILKNQEGVNEIEQLQNQIVGLQSARQVNYDHLMRATFNADTTAAFAETYNYVMDFMETQTDYHAKSRLVDMYIKKGMFENALTILSEMEQIASTSENIGALNDIELTEIKIDILQNLNTESIQDVVKRHEEFLTEMAADYNTKEGGVARAILESAGLMENFPIVFLPNPDGEVSTKSARISEPEQETVLNTELKSLFKLYPNPANDYLAVEFINPKGACSFNIYSMKGELVKTVSSNQQLGFMSINISDLQPGNYIINCPELDSKQNFVIVR